MKKQFIFLTLLSALVLGSCVSPVAKSSTEGGETSTTSESTPAALSSITEPESLDPDNQPENDIHSELQYKYLCDEWTSIKTYVPTTNASRNNPIQATFPPQEA